MPKHLGAADLENKNSSNVVQRVNNKMGFVSKALESNGYTTKGSRKNGCLILSLLHSGLVTDFGQLDGSRCTNLLLFRLKKQSQQLIQSSIYRKPITGKRGLNTKIQFSIL